MFDANANNRFGKYIFALFAPSKLINEPILDHFVLLKIDKLDVRYTRISF